MTHPNDRQKEIDREALRRQVAGILLSGARVTQTQLAEQFGVDQATISRDIKAIEAEWREEAIADIATAKGHDLQRIERLIAAIWQQATKPGVEQLDAIGQIRQLLQRKAAMLGYDAPEKKEVGGLNGGPVRVELVGIDMEDV